MTQTKIAVIVGSLRKESSNLKLARALTQLAPTGVTFEQLQIDDLPLYNQDHDKQQAAAVLRLKKAVEAAQGILFVTAEYNRSIPGVLKNALDHASRPYGQSSWTGKPAGTIGISPGALGTSFAQQHLHVVLSSAAFAMPVMSQPEGYIQDKEGLFDDKGQIAAESTRAYLKSWVEKYVAWVKAHA